MATIHDHKTSKRRSVNLTINAEVLEKAKALNLNASQAAEAGIKTAIQLAQEEEWLRENRQALMAHNKRIEQEGPILTPSWAKN